MHTSITAIPGRIWRRRNAPFFIALLALALSAPAAGAQDATEEPTPVPVVIGHVSGHARNGTAGGTVPEGLDAVLQYGNADGAETRQTRADATGNFRFDDVPIRADFAYQTFVLYRDRLFFGDFVPSGERSGDALDIPVTIYDLTEDPSVITITSSVIQVTVLGDSLNVLQFIRFENGSDRAFTTSQALGGGRFASLAIPLPPGAVYMDLSSSGSQGRFVSLPDENVIVDTVMALPGVENVVQIAYIVPYDSAGAIIEQTVAYRLNGPVRLLINNASVTVSGAQFPSLGPEQIGQTIYQTYGGDLSLQPGDVIQYELSGTADSAATVPQVSVQPESSSPLLLFAIALVVVGALAVAGVLVLRRNEGRERRIDRLIHQIADLDELHESGQINHDLYRRQRAQLRDELEALMALDKADLE